MPWHEVHQHRDADCRVQGGYYAALQAAGDGWHEGRNDVRPFVSYMLRILLACNLDLESRIEGRCGADSTAYAVVRAHVLSRIGRFRSADVMEACPSAGRSAVLASLKQLVEEGVLHRDGVGRATCYVRQDGRED